MSTATAEEALSDLATAAGFAMVGTDDLVSANRRAIVADAPKAQESTSRALVLRGQALAEEMSAKNAWTWASSWTLSRAPA